MAAKIFLQLLFLAFTITNIVEISCQSNSAELSTSWRNNNSATSMGSWTFSDGSHVRPLLVLASYTNKKPDFGFGFFRNGSYNDPFYLVLVKFPISTTDPSFNFLYSSPVVLWCANRDHPVGENAGLELTADGNLVLTESNGTLVWSTDTSGMSVTKARLENRGQLKLLNDSGDFKWMSSDYPTDTWFRDTRAPIGRRLASSVSISNFATGFFYLHIADNGIHVFNASIPDKPYRTLFIFRDGNSSFDFGIGSLNKCKNLMVYRGKGGDFQYIRMEPDGHLRVYQLVEGYKNTLVMDLSRADPSGVLQGSADNSGSSSSQKLKIFLPASLIAGIAVFVSCCYFYLARRKGKRDKPMERRGKSKRAGALRGGSSSQVTNLLRTFSFGELESATQKFRINLGQGGFGSVFEGTLQNGMKVAVKSLGTHVRQGREGFLAEVKTLGSIHHFNLVKLVGYCSTESKRLLVYEYMCNGSLDKWIFHKKRGQILGWETRKKIIVGIAEGLKYLHVHCNPNIIHFDVKPQNILLDEEFNVKIADFGLARLIGRDESEVRTRLKGTRGYMAPELFTGKNISIKVDVYSFGIVILEIICGRRNLDQTEDEFLIDLVRRKVQEDRLSELVERHEDLATNMHDAVGMMEIGIWCLQPFYRRPSMSMVMKVLEGSMPMEPIADHTFLTMAIQAEAGPPKPASTSILPTILSGPR